MWTALDADLAHQRGPSSRVFGSGVAEPVSLATSSSACLTNHDTMPGLAPQHDTAVGPPGAARRAARMFLAQRVVGAVGLAEALVEVEPGPRLGDGVDVERAELAAQLQDVARRGIDRQVDAEALAAALGQQRSQHLAIIVPGQRHLLEAQAVPLGERLVRVGRLDDREPGLVVVEVPFDQRQGTTADRAEADHHDGAGDAAVDGPVGHETELLDESGAGLAGHDDAPATMAPVNKARPGAVNPGAGGGAGRSLQRLSCGRPQGDAIWRARKAPRGAGSRGRMSARTQSGAKSK